MSHKKGAFASGIRPDRERLALASDSGDDEALKETMMGIFDKLKRLIVTAGPEPVEQVPVRTVPQPEQAETIAVFRHHRSEVSMRIVPQPEQAQSSKASDNKPRFSESDMLAVQQRAETVLRAFNEALSVANQSKNREAREDRLHIAREGLIELKQLENKFPFLHLKNLQAVEASIIAVEAETRSLPYGEVVDTSIKDVPDKAQAESLALQGKEVESPERSGQDRQRLSANDERVMLMCIQSCFKVINESIEIARKSKNFETKVSRLGVARERLKEAQKQASQFSLEVEGFDAAEAEINRIDEAIKTGTPTEIPGMQQTDVSAAYSSAARNFLKEATALKREKKYIEACEKLREAYSADGAENLMIEDRLRLPMYLQLAAKNDEGWDELNRLSAKYVDQFSQPRIANQMEIFLRKENNETASDPVRVIVRGDNKPQEAVSEPKSVTMGELQNAPMPSWMADEYGFRFCATLQLRTPLRVLLRDGELYLKNDGHQPQIAREPWEGIWVPVSTKSFEETACGPDSTADDIAFFRRLDAGLAAAGRTVASDVGPILADDYLPFLIAVRRIIEAHDTIEHRIEKLREMPIVADWQTYVDKHRGIDGIIQRFFPKFMNLAADLDTPNRIAAASDETLLGIKGIGPAKLKAIRERCAAITENRDADRVENVNR